MTDPKELEWLREQCINSYVWEMVKAVILNEERKPTGQEVVMADKLIRTKITAPESTFFDMPESYFKGWEKDVEVYVTDEKFSKKEKMQTLGATLQMMGTNSALIQSPLFKNMLDYAGLAEVDAGGQPATEPEIDMTPAQAQPTQQPNPQLT